MAMIWLVHESCTFYLYKIIIKITLLLENADIGLYVASRFQICDTFQSGCKFSIFALKAGTYIWQFCIIMQFDSWLLMPAKNWNNPKMSTDLPSLNFWRTETLWALSAEQEG